MEVSKCAELGDQVAVDILNHAALRLSDYAISLINAVKEEALVAGIYGGVFQYNEYIRDMFAKRVKERYPLVDIRMPDMKPEMSAAIYALGEMKNE